MSDMNEYVVFVGFRLKIKAIHKGNAQAIAKLSSKIEIGLNDNILQKEPFWVVEDLSDVTTCIHGVPLLSWSLIPSFKITEDPRCKKCLANIDGKCSTNIFLDKTRALSQALRRNADETE